MSGTKKMDTPLPVVGEPVHLYILATPIQTYKDLETEIQELKGKSIILGNIPTLLEQRTSPIQTELKRGFFYDILGIGSLGILNGERGIVNGGRISTEKIDIPRMLTLDELKIVAIEYLELSMEEAKKVSATIEPMTAWSNDGRFIIAGLNFGQKDEQTYGLMVNHASGVDTYNGRSKQKIREFLQV